MFSKVIVGRVGRCPDFLGSYIYPLSSIDLSLCGA
jgi:hypothetical protein